MNNSMVFQVFLLVYSIVGVLTVCDRKCSMFLPSTQPKQCGIVFNLTKSENEYVIKVLQSVSANWCVTEQFTKCDQSCIYCIQLSTKHNGTCPGDNSRACECHRDNSYDGSTLNYTEETTTEYDTDISTTAKVTALIALVSVLALLLALVITCWVCTYWKMKKRVRALETTSANNSATENSIQLLFQNLSYDRNSISYSQSPPPDGAIYDLPFQTPAGQTKSKKHNDTNVVDRNGSNRYKTAEENISHAHIVPQIPRANEVEFSGDELQMVCGVTEYEVPVPLKGTKPSLYDST